MTGTSDASSADCERLLRPCSASSLSSARKAVVLPDPGDQQDHGAELAQRVAHFLELPDLCPLLTQATLLIRATRDGRLDGDNRATALQWMPDEPFEVGLAPVRRGVRPWPEDGVDRLLDRCPRPHGRLDIGSRDATGFPWSWYASQEGSPSRRAASRARRTASPMGTPLSSAG